MFKIKKLTTLTNILMFIFASSITNFSLSMEERNLQNFNFEAFIAKNEQKRVDKMVLSNEINNAISDLNIADTEEAKNKLIKKFIVNFVLNDAFLRMSGRDPKVLEPHIKNLTKFRQLLINLIDGRDFDNSLILEAIDLNLINQDNINQLFNASNLLKVIKKALSKQKLTSKEIVEIFNFEVILNSIEDQNERNELANLVNSLKIAPTKSTKKSFLNRVNFLNRLNNDAIWMITGGTVATASTTALWWLAHTLCHSCVESIEPTGNVAIALGAGTATATAIGLYLLNNLSTKNKITLNVLLGKLENNKREALINGLLALQNLLPNNNNQQAQDNNIRQANA